MPDKIARPAAEALRDAAKQLTASSRTPRLDAELLMAHALERSREDMLLRLHDLSVPDGFAELLERRAAGEPIAYILGTQDFWDLTLDVTPDVLIPRPDSETLIEAARDVFADNPPRRIADLGTGSGALLLAALRVFPQAEGIGVDASAAALAVARGNAERHGLSPRAAFALADWRQPGWADALGGPLDLILCNPPYVESGAALPASVRGFEPHSALFAGPEGLDDYAVLIPQFASMLAPGGIAIVEIGHEQAEAVSALAATHRLGAALRRDLAGKPRALVLVPEG